MQLGQTPGAFQRDSAIGSKSPKKFARLYVKAIQKLPSLPGFCEPSGFRERNYPMKRWGAVRGPDIHVNWGKIWP
jgi:hypothetical protein